MAKVNDDVIEQKDVLPLHQNEIDLIWYLRNRYRFGEVTLLMRDGLPQDLLKTVERTRMGTGQYPQLDT